MSRYPFLLFTLFFIASSANGQSEPDFKNDFSIGYRKNAYDWFSKYDSFYIQYRRKFADRIFLKAGISLYGSATNNHTVSANREYFINDTTLILRNQSVYGSGYQIKIGANYSFSKYFNIGIDLIGGKGDLRSYILESGYRKTANESSWKTDDSVLNEYHSYPDESPGNKFVNVLQYEQVVLGFGLDAEFILPILERYEIGLRYVPEFRHFTNKNKELTYLEDDQFLTDIPDYWSTRSFTYLVLRVKF